MPARTPAEATRVLQGSLQRALSCVTREVIIDAQHHPSGPRTLLLPRRPVPLSGEPPLSLEVSYEYTLEPDAVASGFWITATLGYHYVLHLRDGPELIAFHWHPEERNPVKFPHVHLSAGAQIGFTALTRAHVPTGVVPLHDILRFAIEDLAVRPLRSDWATILSQ